MRYKIAWGSGLGLAVVLIAVLGVLLTRSARQLQQSNQVLSTTKEELSQAKEAAETANRAKSLFLANRAKSLFLATARLLGTNRNRIYRVLEQDKDGAGS